MTDKSTAKKEKAIELMGWTSISRISRASAKATKPCCSGTSTANWNMVLSSNSITM